MADFDSADFDIDFEIDEVAAVPRVIDLAASRAVFSIPVSRASFSIEVA